MCYVDGVTNDEKIRVEILKAMSRKGLRQAPLARALGISPQSLNQVVKGSRAALPKSLMAVLDELGLELTVAKKDGEETASTGTSTVRAAPEKPESAPEDSEWLQAFLAAAEGQSERENTLGYHQSRVVLVKLDGQQVKPCVIVSDQATLRKSQIYGIVPLGPPLTKPVGGLTPSFTKPGGGLPASSTALCAEVQTVQPAQIVGYVGKLDARHFKSIKTILAELFALGPAPAGRKSSTKTVTYPAITRDLDRC